MRCASGEIQIANPGTSVCQTAGPHELSGHDRVHAVMKQVIGASPLVRNLCGEHTNLCEVLAPPILSQYLLQERTLFSFATRFSPLVRKWSNQTRRQPILSIHRRVQGTRRDEQTTAIGLLMNA